MNKLIIFLGLLISFPAFSFDYLRLGDRFNQKWHNFKRCDRSWYPSPGLGFGQVTNDQVGTAIYSHLALGLRNRCGLLTGPFMEVQANSDGQTMGGGLLIDSSILLKQTVFSPSIDSDRLSSTRYSMGIHYILIGFDVGFKVANDPIEGRITTPSFGFNVGF